MKLFMLWQTLPKQFIEDYPMPKRVVGASGVPVTVADMSDVAGGGYVLPAATTAAIGGVKKMTAQADSTATDAAGVVTDLNALLAKLRTAGIM